MTSVVRTDLAAVASSSWGLVMEYETQTGVLLARRSQVEKYVVAYAKIVTDKIDGISLAGVFFGGLGDTSEEAEKLAKDCVNTIRGGTILPKVMPIEGSGQLLEAMFDATDKFEQVTAYMVEANDIITRTQNLKK
jgi:hypothetical protein